MKYITEQEAEHRFDEYLNDTNQIIELCGMRYTPAKVLHDCDPIAYNCLMSGWMDAESLTTYKREADCCGMCGDEAIICNCGE